MLSLTFLTGDRETGRKSPPKFNSKPLAVSFLKKSVLK